MEATTVINQYKLDTAFYEGYLVHTVSPVNKHLAPSKKTWKQVRRIGEGVFGSVWLEEGVPTGELRAVKKIYREKNRNVDRELLALIKMGGHQAQFVQFLGWYEDGRDFIFIAMEYLENGDLGKYLKEFRSKARSEAKEITRQLLEGLVALHQNNICHRDLKPNNVLIACHSPIRVKLADFGTSKSTVNTHLRTRCGTPGYMAPELLGLIPRGGGAPGQREAYTTALDIWSLGCVIYEILTSETPFLRKLVDTTTNGYSTHDTPETDIHLFSQFCSGRIGLPVECLREFGTSENGVNFLRKLLVANPASRISAIDALNNRWLFELPELDQSNSSDALREQFRLLGLEFDAQTIGSLIVQCKERRDVDISELLVGSDIRSLVPKAVRMGHTLVVELLLQAAEHLDPGSSKAIAGAGGCLRSAAEHGHLRIVKLFLERGVDANAMYYLGWTVLCEAAKNGHLEVVRLLLENGAGATSRWGSTALVGAAENGHLEVVRLLLDNGADVNIRTYCSTTDQGPTALCRAAMNGHLEVVRLLLENGAYVNPTTYKPVQGPTALCRAAMNGHLKVVRLLLDNDADANATTDKADLDQTALGEAVRNGHFEVARLLIENGADANTTGGWVLPPGESKNKRLKVVRQLLKNDAGADSLV